jgi:hypothetical protein
MNKDLRRIEALQSDGSWIECQVGQLSEGDRFRMYDSDGTPVTSSGYSIFQARDVAGIDADFVDQDGKVVHSELRGVTRREHELFNLILKALEGRKAQSEPDYDPSYWNQGVESCISEVEKIRNEMRAHSEGR